MKSQWTWIVLAFLSGSLLFAAQEKGNGWLKPWAEQLGITLEKTPAPNDDFTELSGTVQNPEKAKPFLGEVAQGQKITLKYAGNVAWTVPTDAGPIRPCVVKASVEGASRTITLVPDYKTHDLKVGPPPFRGSTRSHSGGR